MRHSSPSAVTAALLLHLIFVSAQQNCYYGPGASFRGPTNLVPCDDSGAISACCLLGDVYISGSTCYSNTTGNVYQYGCTDISYEDASCPKKCGWDPTKSPWIGMEFCADVQDLDKVWGCLAPQSCGCEWDFSYELQILPSRPCGAMGSDARVALYAPSTLLNYVSLPSSYGGSTGYYSTTTDSNGVWSVISTPIAGYTPTELTQFTSYRELATSIIPILPGVTPSPSTQSPAYIYTDTAPPIAPTSGSSPATTSAIPSTAIPTTSGVSSSTTTTPSTTAAPVPSSGLSVGAKAGIGVGAAGIACIIAAIITFWILTTRRRKDSANHQQPPQYPQSPPMGPYIHSSQPSGWAPFPAPPEMPYYIVPGVPPKDTVSMSASPPNSPPRSPPPTELYSEERYQQPIRHEEYYAT